MLDIKFELLKRPQAETETDSKLTDGRTHINLSRLSFLIYGGFTIPPQYGTNCSINESGSDFGILLLVDPVPRDCCLPESVAYFLLQIQIYIIHTAYISLPISLTSSNTSTN